MIKTLENEFLSRFKCTGKDCRDSCCHTWGIIVDEISYNIYKSLEDNNRDKIVNAIEVTEVSGKKTYRLKMKDGKCALQVDGLCYIHANLGEKYLCKTCKTYPKNTLSTKGIIYSRGTLSCPVYVENSLFSKEYTDYRIGSVQENSTEENLTEEVMLNVIILSINIIQSKYLTIEKRLAYLAMLYDRLSDTEEKEGLANDYYKDLNEFKSTLESGVAEGILNQIYNGISEEKFVIGEKILDLVIRSINYGHKFICGEKNIKVKEAIIKSISRVQEESFDVIIEEYISKVDKYFKENEHIIENYVLDKIITLNIENNSTKYINTIYMLILQVDLLKYFICLITLDKEKVTKEDIINGIYLFEKSTEHKKIFTELRKEIVEKTSISLMTLIKLI